MGDIVEIHGKPDFLCSGTELPHASTDVWAVPMLAGKITTAHFYQRDSIGYESICGRSAMPAFMRNGQCSIFDPGTFPKCKACLKQLRAQSVGNSGKGA